MTIQHSQNPHHICHKKYLVMGANWQALQHVSCKDPQPAEIVPLQAKWCVAQVHPEVAVVQYTRKLLADWMDHFTVVWKAH
jgi:hypothetical protein